MDVFVINRDGFKADYTNNITGYDSLTWVERYNKPGEFTMICNPVPLQAKLPPGTWISNSLSNNIMVVESHIIEDSKLHITGRTIDAFIMSRRIIKPNVTWDVSNLTTSDVMYYIGVDRPWAAVLQMLEQVFLNSEYTEERISNLYSLIHPDLVSRSSILNLYWLPKKLSLLSDAVYDILQTSDIGIRVERPSAERANYFLPYGDSPFPLPEDGLAFIIHEGKNFGVDEDDNFHENFSMTFNWANGDLMEPRYLWSIKEDRNGFYAYSNQYTFYRAMDSKTGWDYAVASVNADDWNPGTSYDDYNRGQILNGRGTSHVIKESSRQILVDAKITKTAGPKFGIDYHIGDVVPVLAEYGIAQMMRVVEFAMISDKNGYEVIPSLANTHISSVPYIET